MIIECCKVASNCRLNAVDVAESVYGKEIVMHCISEAVDYGDVFYQNSFLMTMPFTFNIWKVMSYIGSSLKIYYLIEMAGSSSLNPTVYPVYATAYNRCFGDNYDSNAWSSTGDSIISPITYPVHATMYNRRFAGHDDNCGGAGSPAVLLNGIAGWYSFYMNRPVNSISVVTADQLNRRERLYDQDLGLGIQLLQKVEDLLNRTSNCVDFSPILQNRGSYDLVDMYQLLGARTFSNRIHGGYDVSQMDWDAFEYAASPAFVYRYHHEIIDIVLQQFNSVNVNELMRMCHRISGDVLFNSLCNVPRLPLTYDCANIPVIFRNTIMPAIAESLLYDSAAYAIIRIDAGGLQQWEQYGITSIRTNPSNSQFISAIVREVVSIVAVNNVELVTIELVDCHLIITVKYNSGEKVVFHYNTVLHILGGSGIIVMDNI